MFSKILQQNLSQSRQMFEKRKKLEKKKNGEEEPKKELAAIFLITTEKEFDNGRLFFFFQTFTNKTNLPLVLFFNKPLLEEKIQQLDNFLKAQNILYTLHFNTISPLEDVYLSPDSEEMKNIGNTFFPPKYGCSSGPNLHFYQTMQYQREAQNIVLVVETDCFFIEEDWCEKMNKMIENKDFLICGSKYPFARFCSKSFIFNHHLNGVAIYNRTPLFYTLLENTMYYITESVKLGLKFVNYDMALSDVFYHHHLQHLLHDVEEILNVSTEAETLFTKENCQLIKPKVVLIHKKGVL